MREWSVSKAWRAVGVADEPYVPSRYAHSSSQVVGSQLCECTPQAVACTISSSNSLTLSPHILSISLMVALSMPNHSDCWNLHLIACITTDMTMLVMKCMHAEVVCCKLCIGIHLSCLAEQTRAGCHLRQGQCLGFLARPTMGPCLLEIACLTSRVWAHQVTIVHRSP